MDKLVWLKTGFVVAAVLAGVTLLARTTRAGYGRNYTTSNVQVFTSSASGQLAGVRNSDDDVQYVRLTFGVSQGRRFVQAAFKEVAGTTASCTSYDESHVMFGLAASPDDLVAVQFTGGTCTSFTLFKGSQFPGKLMY